ncbi:MAG: hypothetical protein FD187_3133, partial [bacterium]
MLHRTHSSEREHRNKTAVGPSISEEVARGATRRYGELNPNYHIPHIDRRVQEQERRHKERLPPQPPHQIVGLRPLVPASDMVVPQQTISTVSAPTTGPMAAPPTATVPPSPALPLLPFKASEAQKTCGNYYNALRANREAGQSQRKADRSESAAGAHVVGGDPSDRPGAATPTSTRTETPLADISLTAEPDPRIMVPEEDPHQ